MHRIPPYLLLLTVIFSCRLVRDSDSGGFPWAAPPPSTPPTPSTSSSTSPSRSSSPTRSSSHSFVFFFSLFRWFTFHSSPCGRHIFNDIDNFCCSIRSRFGAGCGGLSGSGAPGRPPFLRLFVQGTSFYQTFITSLLNCTSLFSVPAVFRGPGPFFPGEEIEAAASTHYFSKMYLQTLVVDCWGTAPKWCSPGSQKSVHRQKCVFCWSQHIIFLFLPCVLWKYRLFTLLAFSQEKC